MTRIKAIYGKGGFAVRADGHATGSAEACAGVSAILFALAGWLENSGVWRHSSTVKMRSGGAELLFVKSGDTEAVMDMTVIGLAQIAAKYPDSVALEIIRK